MIDGVAFHRPVDRDEAVALLASLGAGAMVLGGGTMMVPSLGRREITAKAILDPSRLGLDRIEATPDGGLVLGSRVNYRTLLRSPVVAERAPLLRTIAGGITGGAQIRNQGTIGGSACYANPSSDIPACLCALEARMFLVDAAGERVLDAEEFFRGAFLTARHAGELLTEIEIPTTTAAFGYYKLKLAESSWPIATAVARRDADGARTVLGGVAATPIRLDDVGPPENGTGPEEFDAGIAAAIEDPWSDVLASGEYRRQVAGPVARRAWDRIEGGGR
jgi:carbon-monoxide dehydrogenase medium subunit